jgi:deoxyribonuclease-4
MLIGTHVSISGGYLNAIEEAKRLGIDTMQIFTKNQRFWREKEVKEEEGKLFREGMKKAGIKQAFSHAIYLISLGSEKEEVIEKSLLSLASELIRCEALGLSHTVVHPGNAGSRTKKEAIKIIGERVKMVLDSTVSLKAKILLENTAGQGSSIGGDLKDLCALVNYIESPRVGICFDTCHAYAAGYDIRTEKGIVETLKLIHEESGKLKLQCFHMNDSKGSLGSHVDRHAHVGKGELGLEAFRHIINAYPKIPKVLETSKEDDADVKNLTILRSLRKKQAGG